MGSKFKVSFTILAILGLVFPAFPFGYTVGTIDLGLNSPTDNFAPSEIALSMKPGDSVYREVKTLNIGTNPFILSFKVEKISGDDDFCNTLLIKVEAPGIETVELGPIAGSPEFNPIITSFLPLNPGDERNWLFTVTLPKEVSNSLQNKTCQFKFIFTAHQPEEFTPTTSTENTLNILSPNIALAYFSDVEITTNTIKSGQWTPFLSTEGEGASPTQESFDPNAIALLIQDYNPWFGKNTHDALNELNAPHDLINSSHLTTRDLNKYQFIICASAQDNNYYLNLKNNLQKISDFVANGGLLIAHSVDGGWDGTGGWRGFSILPGGVTHLMYWDGWQYPSQSIHIVDPEHKIVKSDEFTLTDDYLDGWGWSTHGIFTNFLNNPNIKNPKIVMESDEGDGGDGPTYIDYNYGVGKVLATMQTVEWGYFNGSQGWVGNRPELLRNEIRFAKKWTKEQWVEVLQDGARMYKDENGNPPSESELEENKLKCLPAGWILKRELDENGNPIEKSLDGKRIRWFNKVTDVTDNMLGWMERGNLNYDENKQAEWKRKIKIIIFGKNYEISPDFEFNKDRLEYSQKNADIRYLQIILKHEGFFPVDEKATGYFGPVTKESVKKFQEKYNNLDGATGEVGDETIKKLNSILNEISILNESRASIIRSNDERLIDNPPEWIESDFFEGANREEKLGFLLAMTVNESGGLPFFDNEYVVPNPGDCGRGVMQITNPEAVGRGNGLECYGNECKRCESKEDRDSCKSYYTNTNQGIGANLKDGLYELKEKYSESNCQYYSDKCELEENKDKEFNDYYGDGKIRFTYNCGIPEGERKNYCKEDEKDCNSKIKEVAKVHLNEAGEEIVDILIPCNKFRIADSMWRYNGRIVSSNHYLRGIANKLDDTTTSTDEIVDIFGWLMPNKDTWIKELKFIDEGANTMLKIKSPVNLLVYDSKGRVAGLINGKVYTGIPFSSYDEKKHIITVPFSYDSYYPRIVGTETGSYGFEGTFSENENIITFAADDIPISTSTIHQYQIDWQRLSQGEKGVTLNIDVEGDGVFEKTVIADNDLTYDEFILQTQTKIDFDPDTLNLKSKGEFVTVYIEFPDGFDVNKIDISSIMLNDSAPVLTKPTEIGDYDKDGTPDLMAKFKRDEVQQILYSGEEVPIIITGKVFHNGTLLDFKGDDKIKVIK